MKEFGLIFAWSLVFNLTTKLDLVWTWQIHNGIAVKDIGSYDWFDAKTACIAVEGLVATPVSPGLEQAIIQKQHKLYPSYFWSGFRKVEVSSLENEFYTTDNTTVSWRTGHTYTDEGDCVAMEILLIGIRFYSMNCSQKMNVLCYKPENLFNTTSYPLNRTTPLTVIDELRNTSHHACYMFCLSNVNCSACNYIEEDGTCQIFNEGVVQEMMTEPITETTVDRMHISTDITTEATTTGDSVELTTISTDTTTEATTTSDSVELTTISKDFTIENTIDTTDWTTNAPSDVTEVYANKTDMSTTSTRINYTTLMTEIATQSPLNDTTYTVNLTDFTTDVNNYTSGIVVGSTSAYDVVQMYRYSLVFRKGCIPQTVAADNTSIGSIYNYSCDGFELPIAGDYGNFIWKIPSPGLIVCGSDYRWNSLPYCKVQGALCPFGWEEYKGYCYLTNTIERTWREGALYCANHNSFPLYIQSEEEMSYLDKMLYIYNNVTFWTGAANLEHISWYRWSHSYETIGYFRWNGGTYNPSTSECVSLFRPESSDKYYYLSEDCNKKYPVICKMGRIPVGGSHCLDSTWCKGKSVCLKTTYQSYCMCSYPYKKTGNSHDIMTYCRNDWINVNGFQFKDIGVQLYQYKSELVCKTEGGSLITPLTPDIATALKDTFWTPGRERKYWTALYMNDNKELQMTGEMLYDLKDVAGLPWRKIPAKRACVYMSITALGVRLHDSYCEIYRRTMCIGPNYGRFSDSDNSLSTPYNIINETYSSDACLLECVYNKTCMSVTFNSSSNKCYLFNQISTGSNSDPLTIQSTLSKCSPLASPWNGYFTSNPTVSFNGTVTYSCNEGFKILASSEVQCQTNGRWDRIPMCVRDLPKCPNDWEQNLMTCYYLSSVRTSWNDAKSECEEKHSVLVNIHSETELDFMTKLLDVNRNTEYWTGGNSLSVLYWNSWTPDNFTRVKYAKWYPYYYYEAKTVPVDPLNTELADNCIQLRRTFNGSDSGQVYYEKEICSKLKRYVCKRSGITIVVSNVGAYLLIYSFHNIPPKWEVLNIGEMNCDIYPPGSCKLFASCINNTCVCEEGYYQIGPNNDNTTECLKILPIGSPHSCRGYDELCVNTSVCLSNRCSCPDGYWVNGIENSYGTNCKQGSPECPTHQTYFENKCYHIVKMSFHKPTYIWEVPAMACGKINSDPVKIETERENGFITMLSSWISGFRFTGLKSIFPYGIIWLDYTFPNYTNFIRGLTATQTEPTKDTGGFYGMINALGHWEFMKEELIHRRVPNFYVICERPTLCPALPHVQHASYSSQSFDIGNTYTYTCQSGFTFGSDIDGEVTCQRINGQWTDLPTCISIFDSVFNNTDSSILYGININQYTTTNTLCGVDCFNSYDCEAYVFDINTGLCTMYSNVTDVYDALLELLPSQLNYEVLRKKACGAPPTVDHAIKNSTGRSFGSTVRYVCGKSYRAERGISDTLICQKNGHWYPDPPRCISRFKTSRGTGTQYLQIKKVFEIAQSADECKDLCIAEKSFRCISSTYQNQDCLMYDSFWKEGARYEYIVPGTEKLSELMDSDLEEFYLHHNLEVEANIKEIAVFDLSLELCAKECLSLNGICTSFTYFYENINGTDLCSCKLYENQGILGNTTFKQSSYVVILKPGCGPVPMNDNIDFEVKIKQVPNKYTSGDTFVAKCRNFGEEIINGQSDQITCLKTGIWSKIPICKNLCDDGWFMINNTCYKLFENQLPFWKAFERCRTLNAGLVNLQSEDEIAILRSVWNHTNANTDALWIGLYWDLFGWKWTEKLGMDISKSSFNLTSEIQGHSVIFKPNINELDIHIDTASNSYFCEKAAANLACPDGWRNYFGNCIRYFTERLRFIDAKSSCENHNSTLVSIHSVIDADIMNGFLRDSDENSAYIGVFRDVRGQYHWLDGSRLDYFYKVTQERNLDHVGCGVVFKYSITDGYGYQCNEERPYICHSPIEILGEPKDFAHLPCSTDEFCNDIRFQCVGYNIDGVFYTPECRPKDCPPPWRFVDEKCYLLDTTKKAQFYDAIADCVSKGGYIASPQNIWSNHLMYFFFNPPYWIGVVENRDLYGTNATFIMKYQKSPNYSLYKPYLIDYKCVFTVWNPLSPRWKWNWQCNTLLNYLCEKEPVTDISAPVYEGCFIESSDDTTRDIPYMLLTNAAAMSVVLCVDHCQSNGYKFAGIMKGEVCGCGNSFGRYGFIGINCNIACPGNVSQICGGLQSNSVYRTSGNVCADKMLKSPVDPNICYSMVLGKQQHQWSTVACAHQGGSLARLNNPVVEDAVYNQLLLASITNDTNEQVTMWIGLHYGGYDITHPYTWDDKLDATWTMFGDSGVQSNDHCVVTEVLNNGAWKKLKCRQSEIDDPYSFYVCEFKDKSARISGQNSQRKYIEGDIYQSQPSGSWNISDYLDYTCINNPELCPEGFTISFRLWVNSDNDTFSILNTGDCNSISIRTNGFCIFYSNSSLIIVDARSATLKKADVQIKLKTLNNILLYFEDNDTYLFMNNEFVTLLIPTKQKGNTTTIIYDDLVLVRKDNRVIVNNLTFIAAPPDQDVFEKLFDKKDVIDRESEDISSQFILRKLNFSRWNDIGIDGKGIKLTHNSFIYNTGNITYDCNTTISEFTINSVIAFWLKIPFNVNENIQVFSYGGNPKYSKFGMWIKFKKNQELIEILALESTKKFHSNISIETGKWVHLAIVRNVTSMEVYKNGHPIIDISPFDVSLPIPIVASPIIATLAPTTIPPVYTTNLFINSTEMNTTDVSTTTTPAIAVASKYASLNANIIKMFIGTVICPPGWVQHRLSCYRVYNNYGDFWEQERHCQSLGGHMVTIEECGELSFIKSYLRGIGPYSFYLGIYDDLPYIRTYLTRRWVTALGEKQRYLYFDDSFIQNKNNGYNYIVAECDPECKFDVGTNIKRHLELCEINFGKPHGRIELAERCPTGWRYFDGNCYKLYNVKVNAMDAVIECTKQRAFLVEIKSIQHQRFISNIIRSDYGKIYIGMRLILGKYSNFTYVFGDFKLVDFTYWGTYPSYNTSKPCVIMNCANADCFWQDVSCSETYDIVCEKAAETQCAPGWRLFRNKCIALYEGIDAVDACNMSNTAAVSFFNKTELEEYMYLFPITDTSKHCLTDGVVNVNGFYTWKSSGELTYLHYNGEVLSGSGQCIALASSGLKRVDCSGQQCIICQYYITGGIGVDNVVISDEEMNAETVANLSSNAVPQIEYILYSVNYPNGTSLDEYDNPNSYKYNLNSIIKINGSSEITHPVNTSNSCFGRLTDCKQGITVQMWMNVNISNCTLLDTVKDGNTGMTVWIERYTELHVTVKELNYEWRTFLELMSNEWIYLTITWHKNIGLNVYINFKLIYTEKIRRRTWPFNTHIIPSNGIDIGRCKNALDSEYVLMDGVVIRNEAIDDWVLQHDKIVLETRSFFLDFNTSAALSHTNLNGRINDSMVSMFLETLQFLTAINVDNPVGLTPALEFYQTLHCLTQTESCHGLYTLSLCLQPRSMQSDQVFISAGTKTGHGINVQSYKLWYDYNNDQYYFELYYDKTHHKFTFYLILHKWYHLLIKADLPNSRLMMYINGESVSNFTSTLAMNRLIPSYLFSFLEIGGKGQFLIADMQFYPNDKEISYIHNTSHYTLSMDKNTTNESNYIEFLDHSKYEYIKGVVAEGLKMEYSGFNITNLSEACFRNIKHCFLEITFAFWVRLYALYPQTNYVVLYGFGGNILLNESGILMDCLQKDNVDIETLNCQVTVINGTSFSQVKFNLLLNRWYHLTTTWSSYRKLTLYINGHSTSESNTVTDIINLKSCHSDDIDRVFFVGYSLYNDSATGIMAFDDIFLSEEDIEDQKVKKIYGKTHVCLDSTWEFNENTNLCYSCKTLLMKNYDDAEMDCQSFGGNLVYIPDQTTYQWLRITYDVILPSNTNAFTALKQMPGVGYPIRWPDGSYVQFPNNINSFPASTLRLCGMLPVHSSSTGFILKYCSSPHGYICQTRPLYVMAADVHFSINSSTIINSSAEGYIINGNISFTRGITPYSLVFKNSTISKNFTDTCLVNIDFCHNGLTVQFFIHLSNLLENRAREMILNTMKDPVSHGLQIYLHNKSESFMLGIEARSSKNFTTMTVPISVLAWTHVSVSISNTTELTVYLNGLSTGDDSAVMVTHNAFNTTTKRLGDSTEVILGSDWTNTPLSDFLLDKMNITESGITYPSILWNEVSPFFQDFVLSFNEMSLFLVHSNIKHINGWLGNSIFMDTTNPGPVTYKGQFFFDCLGSPNICVEGFTFSIWIHPEQTYATSNILSLLNKRNGIELGSLSSSPGYFYRVTNATGLNTANVTTHMFDLESNVWSHIICSWYKNGTAIMLINGKLLQTGRTDGTINILPSVSNINHLKINDDHTAFIGGLDEFMFLPQPVDEYKMLDVYKNMTYVKFENYWSFDGPGDKGLHWNSSNIINGVVGDAFSIQESSWLNLSSLTNDSSCIKDIDRCVHGLTLHMFLKFVEDKDTDQIIISSMTNGPNGIGFALLYTANNQTMPFRRYYEAVVRTNTIEYKAWFNLQSNVWTDITITWHQNFGIKIFVDKVLAWHNQTGAVLLSIPSGDQHVTIGNNPAEDMLLTTELVVDEIRFWDRAVFEEAHVLKDIVFKHTIHSAIDLPGLLIQPEMTRDECQQMCVDMSCRHFMFCNANRFGTCHICDRNNTSLATTDSPTCDLFTYLSVDMPDQIIGCLNSSCIGFFSVKDVNNSDIRDCISTCRQFENHYMIVINGMCYCGEHRVVSECIAYFSNNSSSSRSCEDTEFLVYSSTGLRDFRNVTVPIEKFSVDIYPGIILSVKQSIELTLQVNENSYAGFSIDFGTGLPVKYTLRNTTTFSYSEPGVYYLDIYALNEISWKRNITTVLVFKPIDNLTITTDELVSTGLYFNITVLLEEGSNVTCEIYYGDGFYDNITKVNSSDPFLFTHLYLKEDGYTVNVTCYNYISYVSNFTSIQSLNPIKNITISNPNTLVFGDVLEIGWTADMGSNASVILYLNDKIVFNFTWRNLSINDVMLIFDDTYRYTGNHTLNLTARNILSGPEYSIGYVVIEREIQRVKINFNKTHYRLNETVDFTVILTNGSNVYVTIYSNEVFFKRYSLEGDIGSELIMSDYIIFSIPGRYEILVFAANIVSNRSFTKYIDIEAVVDDLMFTFTYNINTYHIDIIVSLPIGYQEPTNAVKAVDFGDGFYSYDVPLELSNGQEKISYNFSALGTYMVSVNVSNNVSFISANNLMQIGDNISNLTVKASKIYIPLGDEVSVSVNKSSGSLVSYVVNFGDGTNVSIYEETTLLSYIPVLTHMFSEVGIYHIRVSASNIFNKMTSETTVYILDKISGLDLTGETVGKVGQEMGFQLQIVNLGTNSCFVFDFGDSTVLSYGDFCPYCAQCNESNIPLTSNIILVTHRYYTEGDYQVVVNTTNKVTYYVKTLSVKVLYHQCSYPIVNIYGYSSNVSSPTNTYLTNRLVIPAKVISFCVPADDIIFHWCLTLSEQNFGSICSFPQLSSLILRPQALSLSYGLYEVNVTVHVNKYPNYTDYSRIYLLFSPSPLVIDLIGDELCTSRLEDDLIVDASYSYDPGFPNNKDINAQWYCGTAGLNQANLKNSNKNQFTILGNGNCFPNKSNDSDVSSLVIKTPKHELHEGMELVFVLELMKENRSVTKMQKILITNSSVHKLAIRCKGNCRAHVSSSLPYRAIALCQTCTGHDRYIIPYKWTLFEVNGTALNEIIDFQSWTNTDLNSSSLVIKEDKLSPGIDYAIKLESGQAYTVKYIHVDEPPYNGQCYSDKPLGTAFKTKFVFSCKNWLDEGFRSERNISRDLHQLEVLTYSFYYKKVGTNEIDFPLFMTSGIDVASPELILGPGEQDQQHLLEIIVIVTDRYLSSTRYSFLIQVYSTISYPSEVLGSIQMDYSRAELDINTISVKCHSAIDMANKLRLNDLSFTEEKDIEVRIAVIDILNDEIDLVQNEVQLISISSTLNKVIQFPGNIPVEGKEKIITLLKNLIGSQNVLMKEDVVTRRKIAKALANILMEYVQRTKYTETCTGYHCSSSIIEGEIAIESIALANNITHILLKDVLPGEKGILTEVIQGDTKYYVQRVHTYDLRDDWICLNDHKVAFVPGLISALDLNETSILDIEVILSDNIFTTDKSAKVVKSRTISLALFDVYSKESYSMSNLYPPITISFYPQQSENLNFTEYNLKPKGQANMFYIKMKMNETQVIPIVALKPKIDILNLTYYIKVNEIPNNVYYDFSTSADLGQSYNDSVIILQMDQLRNTVFNDTVYIGIVAEFVNPLEEPLVDIAVYVLGCSYWDLNLKTWRSNGVSVGKVTRIDKVPCSSTHLTTFGVNMFVPPNTIDFTTVWVEFTNIGNNALVFSICIALIVIYFACMIFLRKADGRDIEKWAIYPLRDNVSTDVYHYHMTVYTGMRRGAGTQSKVYFVIGGESGDTEIRELMDTAERSLCTGSVNHYLLSVPSPIGHLVFMRIWHDNSGKRSNADWYLNVITIRDIQTDKRYVFVCDRWLSTNKEDGQIDRLVPVSGFREIQQFGHAFYMKTRKDLTDGHLWISLFSRPTRSTFTRVQRLSCCLSLLFTTMIANAMWYQTAENSPNQQNVHLGPFVFSSQEFFTSLMGSLIVIPLNLVIITLFKKSKQSPVAKKSIQNVGSKETKKQLIYSANSDMKSSLTVRSVDDISVLFECDSNSYNKNTGNEMQELINKEKPKHDKQKQKTGVFTLPSWCRYIAFVLVALSVVTSGVFVILYSLEWGFEKSSRWFTAFFLSFLESVLLIQPIKVIAVAVVLILIFKNTNDEEESSYDNIINRENINKQSVYTTYPPHRRPFVISPLDPGKIKIVREYQKKINKLFTISREVLVYLVYLSIVAVLTYENRDMNSFYLKRNLENLFIKTHGKYLRNFEQINSEESFWNWINHTVLPTLYTDNAAINISDRNNFLSDNIHYKIGMSRLRQARVRDTGCKVSKIMSSVIPHCFEDYNAHSYESQNFSTAWRAYENNSLEAWIYQTAFDLQGFPVVGDLASYSGGGYVVHFGESIESARSTINYLIENNWIDRRSRAVFLEFNVFNPNINLFAAVRLLTKFSYTGGANPHSEIQPLRLYRYHGESAIFILVFDLLFVVFTLYYIFELVQKIKIETYNFFTKFWNLIELLNVCLSIISCVFYGIQLVIVRVTLNNLHLRKDSFVNFQQAVIWDQLFGYIAAFLLFLSMLKLLLILRFNTKITQFAGILKKSQEPLLSFFVLFIFAIFAFSAFGHLVFGNSNKDYVTLFGTMETLMSMIMMKLNIDRLMVVDNVLASLYLFSFVLLIVFIQLNILISIINEVFTEVREDPSCLPDDPKLVGFIIDECKRLICGYPDNPATKTCIDNDEYKETTVENDLARLHFKLLRLVDQSCEEWI